MYQQIQIGGLLIFAACCEPGCVVAAEDTDEENEDVEEAASAMTTHDSGLSLAIDEKCEEACRALLSACIDACRSQPPKDRPPCVGLCSSAYGECVRDCGYGGGCQSGGFGWRCW